jgi:outer membrane protein assembly factor BamB
MLRRILFIAAVVAIAPGCSTVKGWFGGREADKVSAPAPLTAFTAAVTATPLWKASVGDGEGRSWLRQHPTIADGRVYVADGKGNLLALDVNTGQQLWAANAVEVANTKQSMLKFWKREKNEVARLSGSPGVGNGLVVIGGRNGEVVAFSDTGEKKWSVKVTSEVLSAPLVTPTRVIVRANDGRVFGLDPADGSRKWVFDRGLPTLTVRGNATPVGGNGISYIGYDDGTVVAIREEDGLRVWEQIVAEPEGGTELARMADIDGEMMLDDDTLYVVSYHDRVMALSAQSGQPLWAHDIGGWSGAALTPDKVLLTDKTGNVWALNRATGDSLWKQNIFENRQLTSPVVHGDYVVVGDLEGYLHWLKLETGELAGRVRVDGGALRGTPQVTAEGTLVALSNEGHLAAYRLGN